ncbi:MAG TPA: LLM class F420-dependent oxidoreductase [Mycobacteriales bacterium]|jgi:probable F420-dependent oxidoreductase|nr:LLM class F420-dependent oxidoreductase [Mycobacteriales bacterium]
MELGRVGVWHRDVELTPDLASGLERLGYGAVWIGGSPAGDLAVPETLLDSTRDIVVATGIVNIWQDGAGVVAESYHRIEARHPGRFLLGIGAGHREAAREYTRPYEALVQYLDALDTAGVPPGRRVLAALGPRVLRLARDRTAGAHPYFTTPDHTREARAVLGPDALLAPEQKVVLEPDPHAARALARPVLGMYLGLANYVANFRRMGFTDEDFAGGGSDRLVDALIAHGDPDTVARRVTEHLDAGADHVAVQLLVPPGGDLLAGHEQLGRALSLTR